MNRRNFLHKAGCASLGTLPFLSTWMSLSQVQAAAINNAQNVPDSEDYRALVCILLAGGNDSFNMLVPRGASEHAAYSATRSNLALPQAGLLPIRTSLQTGIDLGIHPSMPEVQQLYQDKKLAFISNIGTLVEPMTKAEFQNDSLKIPLGLFSHSDQIMHWQTSVPNERNAIGWGGKMADLLSSLNGNQNVSMNISLSGNNVFQAGNKTVEYTIEPGIGAKTINGYQGEGFLEQIRTQAVNSLLELQYQNIFHQTYVNTINVGIQANQEFSQALNSTPALNSSFSSSPISPNFEMIARTIGARKTLNMKRQTFFISFGGWDHHDEVINTQAQMLGVVSKALGEFQAALEELGVADCVTTFGISDFARTLTSNGNGSDHGWGGNTFVMGGHVKGGEVYGQYPDLALHNNLDVGGGVLIPTTATDQYFAELALWMGVSPNDLSLVLPNIGNFYSPGSPQLPIGFLKS